MNTGASHTFACHTLDALSVCVCVCVRELLIARISRLQYPTLIWLCAPG